MIAPSTLLPEMTADDRELVQRLLAGDESAFRGFFNEYFDRLFRFGLTRLAGDRQLAEEAAQRALCRAVRRLETYRGEASLFTWLAQICRNEIADLNEARFRDRDRTVSLDSDSSVRLRAQALVDESASDPADSHQDLEQGRLIRAVLDELPGHYGQVLEWKYIEELDVREIATRLGVSFASAQSTLQRARESFRSAVLARGLSDKILGP